MLLRIEMTKMKVVKFTLYTTVPVFRFDTLALRMLLRIKITKMKVVKFIHITYHWKGNFKLVKSSFGTYS